MLGNFLQQSSSDVSVMSDIGKGWKMAEGTLPPGHMLGKGSVAQIKVPHKYSRPSHAGQWGDVSSCPSRGLL